MYKYFPIKLRFLLLHTSTILSGKIRIILLFSAVSFEKHWVVNVEYSSLNFVKFMIGEGGVAKTRVPNFADAILDWKLFSSRWNKVVKSAVYFVATDSATLRTQSSFSAPSSLSSLSSSPSSPPLLLPCCCSNC
ncbi:wsv144 [White spot syndrome virus]|uniref:Wsv144 n=4 Tax=White spot syndrome virus TaxID=342409 RepID=Q8VB52_WSSVS|nr:wsv144 [Shrimp white spot syndrome virus]AFX59520.1 wsv144 [White spot syndrome virus]AAL33148.1 wsv144 [Shrimp white spot syndrome virus]AAL89067.1 WSSV199 [Shrimp white spot syndrome virus]AWQ60328.1 wsv144 [Shrimp white spot syndrome virus]AWQ60743.1 wsv144 [Shrimp white spot syndrome virus]